MELGDEAPLYDRPHVPTPAKPVIDAATVTAPIGNREALIKLIGSPDLASKRWVWEQYDHLILGNSVQQPGGDAAVIRLGDGPKGLAMCTDVTQRYCEADPVQGGRQAVAEAWRNITAVGGKPLALTDNLNFGNPEKPEIMGQFVGCLQGIGEAARALDFPIVSGNVSLYNQTQGRDILPTPSIGGVGLVDDVTRTASLAVKAEGEIVLLVGGLPGWLGQSVYLRDICGREEGAPPPVDLEAERRNGDFVRELIHAGRVTAVHDISDGGLAVAVAEMAMAGNIGIALEKPESVPAHGFYFGEDQGRYVLTARAADVAGLESDARARGVALDRIGTTGTQSIVLTGEEFIPLTTLAKAHEDWLPSYMAAGVA